MFSQGSWAPYIWMSQCDPWESLDSGPRVCGRPQRSKSNVDLTGPQDPKLQSSGRLAGQCASEGLTDRWVTLFCFRICTFGETKARPDMIVDPFFGAEGTPYCPSGLGVWMKVATTCLSSSGLFLIALLSFYVAFFCLLDLCFSVCWRDGRWESDWVRPNCPWAACAHVFSISARQTPPGCLYVTPPPHVACSI